LEIVVRNVFGVLMNIVVPLLLNPDAADPGGKVGFIFVVTAVESLVWCYFRVPDTMGKVYGELDRSFERGVPAGR
jgi:MFS transporter, SP family, general alpha glucoside:H+ symporter